jgi:uncharacterized membrane protein
VFGSFLLLAHAITGAEPKAHLGEMPGLLIVFAGIVGAALGALGGASRAARQRRSVNREASDGTLPARSRTDTP